MFVTVIPRYQVPMMEKVNYDTAVIAIRSLGDDAEIEYPKTSKIKGILQLQFDDITRDIPCYCAFEKEQAEQVVDFVLEYQDKVEMFVCQCDAGISRSAGVALVLDEMFQGNGVPIKDDPRFSPNPLVVKLLREAFKAREK